MAVLAVVLAYGSPYVERGRDSRIQITLLEFSVITLLMIGVAMLVTQGGIVIVQWILKKKRPSLFARLILASNMGLVAALGYARYVEPHWIRVERVEVRTSKVAAPFRIVLISDLHSDPRFDLDERVAALVNAQDADLVIFAGDSLNQSDRLPSFRAVLGAMHAKVGKLAIRGNWDAWFWHRLDLFEGTGFEELNGWRTFEMPGGPLHVGGAKWLDGWDPEEIFGDIPANGMRVFVYHANDYLEIAETKGIDLYLCGDTHGGQIALPGYGALFTVGRLGRRYVRGLYTHGAMRAFVTSGVGVEGVLPLRFGVRPEVIVLDLFPAEVP
jgi:predicted MPP superfamily phosphohydrolase